TEKRQALVADKEGVTRDSNIGQVSWGGKTFGLIDTGGILDLKYLTGKKDKTEDVESKVQKQALEYLNKANLILFMVDNKTGLLPQDKQMALFLKKNLPKKQQKKIILTANKVDSPKQRAKTAEFHKLSMGEPIPVSASSGSGTGDLLDIIIKKIPNQRHPRKKDEETAFGKKSEKNLKSEILNLKSTNVCIIGKPNVGKSSLINSILGYERVIVSAAPHTTREPQDTKIEYNNQIINLIDTAGISRKGAKTDGLEKYGIEKSLSALNKADIALLILDINKNITHQDAKLVEEIFDRKKSLIIVANKWDLIEERDTKRYTKYIYAQFPFAHFAPIQFTSALTGEKTKKVLDLVLEIKEQRGKKLGDSQLNKFLVKIVKRHKPAKAKGTKHPRIYELKQTRSDPPKFELRIGPKDTLHFSYVRFIENRLREQYGFMGTPLTTRITKGRVVHGMHDESVARNA
ncbi:ribosome biogenesis GTPase Der, partial [Patescibacteria group bacterium]|nr:ribosome biogenesis GTPase Der [Patescibacteria group bacterium]